MCAGCKATDPWLCQSSVAAAQIACCSGGCCHFASSVTATIQPQTPSLLPTAPDAGLPLLTPELLLRGLLPAHSTQHKCAAHHSVRSRMLKGHRSVTASTRVTPLQHDNRQ